jgi:hypothetical protein
MYIRKRCFKYMYDDKAKAHNFTMMVEHTVTALKPRPRAVMNTGKLGPLEN